VKLFQLLAPILCALSFSSSELIACMHTIETGGLVTGKFGSPLTMAWMSWSW
jgi:hypothetical protein